MSLAAMDTMPEKASANHTGTAHTADVVLQFRLAPRPVNGQNGIALEGTVSNAGPESVGDLLWVLVEFQPAEGDGSWWSQACAVRPETNKVSCYLGGFGTAPQSEWWSKGTSRDFESAFRPARAGVFTLRASVSSQADQQAQSWNDPDPASNSVELTVESRDRDGDGVPDARDYCPDGEPGSDSGCTPPSGPTPTARCDAYSVERYTVLRVGSDQGILANDSDPLFRPLTAEVTFLSFAASKLNLDRRSGAFTYDASANDATVDVFQYQARATDTDVSAPATVYIFIDRDIPPDIRATCGGRPACPGTAGNNLILGTGGNDALSGTPFGDTIRARAGDDRVDGAAGNDCVFGEDGDDFVSGGSGKDLVTGGVGSDTVGGGAGVDALDGGLGNDVVLGNEGRDTIIGGPGSDLLSDGRSTNAFSGGDGRDTIFSRQSVAESVDCGGGADIAVVDRTDSVAGCETVVRGSYWNAGRRPARVLQNGTAAPAGDNDGSYNARYTIRNRSVVAGIAATHFVGAFELNVSRGCARQVVKKVKLFLRDGRSALVLTGQALGVSAVVLKAKLLAPGANLAPLRAYVVSKLVPLALRVGQTAAALAVSWIAKKGTDWAIGTPSNACKIMHENVDAWRFAVRATTRMARNRAESVRYHLRFTQIRLLTCRWDQWMTLSGGGADHFHVDFRGYCP